jgi:chromosome segregation ATPase
VDTAIRLLREWQQRLDNGMAHQDDLERRDSQRLAQLNAANRERDALASRLAETQRELDEAKEHGRRQVSSVAQSMQGTVDHYRERALGAERRLADLEPGALTRMREGKPQVETDQDRWVRQRDALRSAVAALLGALD